MNVKRKVLMVAGLAAILILMFAGQSFANPSDIQNHWAEKQISDWVEIGLISGYPDGVFKPDNNITRAEFIALVNRSFGKSVTAQVYFTDVSDADWFAAEVAKAAAAGYIFGYDDGSFRPNEFIQRQEAAVILSKLLNLNVSAGAAAADQFADSASIPLWSKGYIGAVAAGGYMSGYPDQTFQAAGYITRAEAVSALYQVITISVKTVTYDQAGVYGPAEGMETVEGNVNISAAGVTLQNTVITGNLLLAESIGAGDVTLKGVTVQGNTVIKGGGSQSVFLENCALPNIIVSKEGVRVVASGNTSVSIVRLETGAMLIEMSLSGPGFEKVFVTEIVPAGAKITLEGSFENVNVTAGDVILEITGGNINSLEISETAAGSVIGIAGSASVNTFTVNAAVSVTGEGTIDTAKINVPGSTFEQEPKNVEKAAGVTVETGTGGGSKTTATITISNILATNTLGKFKFDTDTVTTVETLEGKILADGVAAITIAKRSSGEDGRVWNAFIATTPYEYDYEYVITCESPFVISGSDTVIWSSSNAAPAATNVTVDDIGDNGDGSDLEVSFDAPKGQNSRIESYRVIVVKSADASGFDLADAESAAGYTEVGKIDNAASYTEVLASDACDVDGDAVIEGVSYKVFVLSIADGTNATENSLSSASASIALSSGGGGGGGGGGDGGGVETIAVSNILTTNTLGKFKFDTGTATSAGVIDGKIFADGVAATDIAARGGDLTGKLWNAFIATTPYQYNYDYVITSVSPLTISGAYTIMWPGTVAAPAATSVTAIVYGDSGNGSDLEISFTAPKGQNTKIASYRVLVVKSAAAASYDLTAANAAAADNYTNVDKIVDAASYTVQLAPDANDTDGDAVTDSVPYKIFVLSVADGVNATENALSAASNEVTLNGGSPPPVTITISGIAAASNLGKFKFDTDTVTTSEELAGKIKANGDAVTGITKRNTGEDGKVWNASITGAAAGQNYTITCEDPFIITGNDIVSW